jgi:hypothetical protein
MGTASSSDISDSDDLAGLDRDELVVLVTELRRRADVAERSIAELRREALERRAEVRALTEALPVAMSRNTLLRSMVSDAWHHPDKAGVLRRGVRKLARAPRKALRVLRGRT